MNNRLNKIDEIRGLTLISMILYHFCWDLRYIAGFSMDWYEGMIGRVWQQSICITFILVSGFCFSLGKKRFKRSMLVSLCGLIITAVTLLVMPQNRIIFGVLTFLGFAGLLTIPLDKFVDRMICGKTNGSKGEGIVYTCILAVSFILFLIFYSVNKQYLNLFFTKAALPDFLYSGYVNTFIGFTDKAFFSTDYFSLLPWYFLYLCGYFLYKAYALHESKQMPEIKGVSGFLKKQLSPMLAFLGRHSLIIYMLHQPVAYAIVELAAHLNHH